MSLNTALSGLKASSTDLDVISNNVANASTTGFKKAKAHFSDLVASMGANSTGDGVKIDTVSQNFSQGQLSYTEHYLDLAINGNGFFILDDATGRSFSRAGHFDLDSNGMVVNSNGQVLQGYGVDANNNINNTIEDLRVVSDLISPKATSSITMDVNLDSTTVPPLVPFERNFNLQNPPDPNSYNHSTTMVVYNGAGESSVLTSYFVKSHVPNTWNMYLGLDGADITPVVADYPNVGDNYPVDVEAVPYTLVFSDSGQLMPFNGIDLPSYQGAPEATSLPNGAGALGVSTLSDAQNTTSGLKSMEIGDLVINGISIPSPDSTADSVSTVDKKLSAISIVSSINASTDLHGAVASINSNIVNMGQISVDTAGDLSAGDFTLNGVDIIAQGINDLDDFVEAINNFNQLHKLTASNSSGELVISATDGRNISLKTNNNNSGLAISFTDYTDPGSANYFAIGSGTSFDKVARSSYTVAMVNQNESLKIAGASPASADLVSNTLGIVQPRSDIVEFQFDGAQVAFNLSSSTQFGTNFTINTLEQNGYPSGQMTSLDINNDGVLVGRFSNGQSNVLGQVALANFPAEAGLQMTGNTAWADTVDSGTPIYGPAGDGLNGSIQSGSLENSNVDLTNELVNLIITQRNFQANAQTIQTVNQITQSILNLR